MKCFLLGCFITLFYTNILADEVNIDLEKKDHVETRSLSAEPTATHDENVVYIYYSDYLLENLQIIVKDLLGNVVYFNTINIFYNQPYSFSLNNVESGEFILELNYGNILLHGYFNL